MSGAILNPIRLAMLNMFNPSVDPLLYKLIDALKSKCFFTLEFCANEITFKSLTWLKI